MYVMLVFHIQHGILYAVVFEALARIRALTP